MTSKVTYFRKCSSNFLKSLILFEMDDSLKTVIFLFPLLLKKSVKGRILKSLVWINASTSIDELWRNVVSTSPCPIKSARNYFGKEFVIHSFSSVANTPSMKPEWTNKFKLPLIVKSPLLHAIRCSNLYNPKIHSLFSLVLRFLARPDKLSQWKPQT